MSDDSRATDLYRRYGPAIYARCSRLLGDDAAAEDATQETFLRVYKNLAKAPDDARAKLWIYRIATNHCLDLLRARATRGQARPALELPRGRNVEELLADRELAQRIIALTPARLHATAFLHYVDGLDQGEVADTLGVSRRTIGNWVAEFLRCARELLKRETP